MYRKKFLPKLVIASLLVGGVNFVPAIVNFDAENLQIISVAYAEVQNVTASGETIFNFGEDDAQIVNTVKNVAKMRAIQAAKEKAGVYVKSQTKTVNGILTDDDISAYTSNNIQILNVQYKKIPVQAHDVKGNDTGKIAFMYEATVTAKIDTSGLTAYIQRDFEERQNIIQQNKSLQQNIEKINQDFDSLRYTFEYIEHIKDKLGQIDNEILAQQKLDEGWQFYWKKDYSNAIFKFDEAIRLNENFADAYYGRASAYNKLENYFDAIKNYTQAIKINQNFTLAYVGRGFAYRETSAYKKAMQDYNQAIKLNPKLPVIYNNIATVYFDFDDYQKAIAYYTKAIQIDSNYAMAYYNRGYIYYELDYYTQAIKDFTKYIQLSPNDTDGYRLRGFCYRELGMKDKANADLSKVVELSYKNF